MSKCSFYLVDLLRNLGISYRSEKDEDVWKITIPKKAMNKVQQQLLYDACEWYDDWTLFRYNHHIKIEIDVSRETQESE